MANELATTPKNGALQHSVPLPEAIEKALIDGDLSSLNAEQRVMFYRMRCEAAGLDYRAQPFQYVRFKGRDNEPGKLTLYATKAATDQLIANRKLRVEITRRGFDGDTGCYAAEARVTFPDGQWVEDMGAVPFAWKDGNRYQGEQAGNAMMKAITKAKRRTVLSACGLGMLDETEIDSIPDAVKVATYGDAPKLDAPKPEPPQNNSGFGRGQYASEEQAKEYLAKMEPLLTERNQKWIERWVQPDGQIPDGVKDLCNTWQADGHLVKWGVATGRLAPACLDEHGKIKNRQVGRYSAVIYFRSQEDRKALGKELVRYLDEQEANQLQSLRAKHPELFADDPDMIDDAEIGDDEPNNVNAEPPTASPEPAKRSQGSFLGDQKSGAYSAS